MGKLHPGAQNCHSKCLLPSLLSDILHDVAFQIERQSSLTDPHSFSAQFGTFVHKFVSEPVGVDFSRKCLMCYAWCWKKQPRPVEQLHNSVEFLRAQAASR